MFTYYRCKCGKVEVRSNGNPPKDNKGCLECGTTLATSPEGHKLFKIEEDPEAVCSECAYIVDDDCDNPLSKRYGENVDGIVVECEFFKSQNQ